MPEEKKDGNDRKGIISAIDSPIRLAALIVLVVEALLGTLLTMAKRADLLIYVSMMVGVLLVSIVMTFIIEYKRVGLKGNIAVPQIGTVESQAKDFKWDVFLAAPMAGIKTEEDFTKAMGKMEELMKTLEDECNYKRIYFAGKGMKTKKDFDNAGLSVKEDTDAIKDSRLFILIYPDEIVSSVLYEAGIALAYGKPSFYFGKDFPFLMKEANNVYKHIRIYNAATIDDVIATVKINKQTLFNME
jgi:hypothetical protein